jgi:hypothetical protein
MSGAFCVLVGKENQAVPRISVGCIEFTDKAFAIWAAPPLGYICSVYPSLAQTSVPKQKRQFYKITLRK